MERGEVCNNKLIQILNIKDQKVIIIKENHLAEAQFIIPHLLVKILNQSYSEICFVTLHKPLQHYKTCCKKLGYKLVENNRIFCIENFHEIIFELDETPKEELSEHIVKEFLKQVMSILNQLNRERYLVIDDITHLLDLGIEIKHIMNLVNMLINMNITCIFGTHKSEEKKDEIVSNYLERISDIVFQVSPLKTGRSEAVSGFLHVLRQDNLKNEMYHYKTNENNVEVFEPGETYKYLK
nr:uncharacterized protein LOC111422281 [Onthophagus taurus]XP_022911254.1 uncharacterized protein LOC111422281 [Onthophagus taurus]